MWSWRYGQSSTSPESTGHASLPRPPIRMSPPAASCPFTVSLPLPPIRTSRPVPPVIWSLPLPPLTVSFPSWPFRTSGPFPPRMMSFPPAPLMVSAPFPPQMTSLPDVPVRVSEAFVPTIVQSADVSPTVVVVVAELLVLEGSAVDEVTFAVLVMMVPFGVAAFTFTTRVNEALASSARLGLLQLTAPVPPTEGVEQLQPAAVVRDTNVVLVGVVSESDALVAVAGPPLVTPIEYVMFDPATTGSGESDFVMARLAPGTASAGSAGSNSTPTPASNTMTRRSLADGVMTDPLPRPFPALPQPSHTTRRLPASQHANAVCWVAREGRGQRRWAPRARSRSTRGP